MDGKGVLLATQRGLELVELTPTTSASTPNITAAQPRLLTATRTFPAYVGQNGDRVLISLADGSGKHLVESVPLDGGPAAAVDLGGPVDAVAWSGP